MQILCSQTFVSDKQNVIHALDAARLLVLLEPTRDALSAQIYWVGLSSTSHGKTEDVASGHPTVPTRGDLSGVIFRPVQFLELLVVRVPVRGSTTVVLLAHSGSSSTRILLPGVLALVLRTYYTAASQFFDCFCNISYYLFLQSNASTISKAKKNAAPAALQKKVQPLISE